jgi:hypothetical protein
MISILRYGGLAAALFGISMIFVSKKVDPVSIPGQVKEQQAD